MTKDTVLGPYPKTPEERAAAAKKYNMRVEDYEPYPDNGEGSALLLINSNTVPVFSAVLRCSTHTLLCLPGTSPLCESPVITEIINYMLSLCFCSFGDYPKLPDRSQHERDPWYQWDHPDLRRNWGEPVR